MLAQRAVGSVPSRKANAAFKSVNARPGVLCRASSSEQVRENHCLALLAGLLLGEVPQRHGRVSPRRSGAPPSCRTARWVCCRQRLRLCLCQCRQCWWVRGIALLAGEGGHITMHAAGRVPAGQSHKNSVHAAGRHSKDACFGRREQVQSATTGRHRRRTHSAAAAAGCMHCRRMTLWLPLPAPLMQACCSCPLCDTILSCTLPCTTLPRSADAAGTCTAHMAGDPPMNAQAILPPLTHARTHLHTPTPACVSSPCSQCSRRTLC